MKQDVMEKRAGYISKNNEIVQEFHYAHPKTLVKINNIFNSHFYGSTLWDLQSKEVDMVQKTWNVSQRVMHGLDRKTHKYLIEPISQTRHIMFHFHKRFINFISKIQESQKQAMRSLFASLKHDCQSVTGRNIRFLMNKYNKGCINELNKHTTDQGIYQEIPDNERWRVDVLKELVDVKKGDKNIAEFKFKELEEIMEFVATT